jgi:hypothetical protein
MRFDDQVAYPHPVMRPDTEDYIDGEFQAVAEPSVSADQKTVRFSFSYQLSVREIEELLENGSAKIGLLVDCRDTFFRKIYEIGTGHSHEISIEGGNLHGEVEFVPIIFAVKDISGFQSLDFHPEFSGLTFNLPAGSFIAYDEPRRFYLEREAFSPLESVFELQTSTDLSEYEWTLNLDGDKVAILVSEKLSTDIQKLRSASTSNKLVLVNSIYSMALIGCIEHLRGDGQNSEATWANVIRQKCAAAGDINLESDEIFLIAQRLFKYPIQKLTQRLLAEEIT